MGNLVPGGSAGGSRFVIDEEGYRKMRDAIQAIPVNMKKHMLHSAVRSVSTVSNRARANFESNPRRPAEAGEGVERERQTGKFLFGGKDQAGVAFHGSVFTLKKDVFGFGYPNIADADKATNFVWRSLEFGLPGTAHDSHALFPENSSLFPQGKHRLPKRFYFTTPSPGTSQLKFPKKGARKGPQGQQILKDKEGRGFEGKHFIEEAWMSSLEILSDRFQQDVVATAREFGK